MNASADLADWVSRQQDFLRQLTNERDPERLKQQLETWWREAGNGAQGPVQELAARLLDLGQTYLQGLQQFATAASQSRTPDFTQPGTQQPFSVGADLMAAWRNARLSTDFTSFGMTGGLAAPWLDALGNLPPIGPGREYITEARELAEAHAECQRLEEQLGAVMKSVQLEALELLQQRVNERTQAGEGPQSFRQLYDIWIECGERAYSRTAHAPEFAELQADFANALMRLRALQRRVVERSLRKLDLPTRAELNTLHRQVRDLKRKLGRDEQPPQAPARPANADHYGASQRALRAKAKAKASKPVKRTATKPPRAHAAHGRKGKAKSR